MVSVVDRARALRTDDVLASRWSTPAILAVLSVASLSVRTQQLRAGFWIDEGLSVGIAHHHLTSIPGLLHQDGSPPAYYLLLGVWIRLFGDSERATHTLSLVFAVGCVPLAFAVGRSVFDRSTGFVCAVLAAFDPYLTYYAQETRMYSVEAFLSLLVVLAYVNGILRARRLWTVAFVLSLVAMLYVHNWALFLCVGLAVATVLFARERLAIFGVAALGVAVLYAPWVPTLLSQARHTGAPWSTAPSFHDLVLAPGTVFNGDAPLMAFVLAGGVGLALVVRRRGDPERTVILALLLAAAITITLAWLLSQVSPAWTARYFAVVLGPLAVVAARGLVRARRLGMFALLAVLFLWAGYSLKDNKENAREVSAAIAPSDSTRRARRLDAARAGAGLPLLPRRPAPLSGTRRRSGLWRIRRSSTGATRSTGWKPRSRERRSIGCSRRSPLGHEFVVVTPVFRDYRAWNARWTKLVWQRSVQWTTLLQADPRVRLVRHIATNEVALHRNYFKPMQAFVYRRLR